MPTTVTNNPVIFIDQEDNYLYLSDVLFQTINEHSATYTAREITKLVSDLKVIAKGDLTKKLVDKYIDTVYDASEFFPEHFKNGVETFVDFYDNEVKTTQDLSKFKPIKIKRELILNLPVIVIGHTGSGKTTLCKELSKLNLKVAKMDTDRPKRGRGDNMYKFVKEFKPEKYIIGASYDLLDNVKFNYGLTKKMIEKSEVFDLNPRQVQELIKHKGKCIILHLKCNKDVLRMRFEDDGKGAYDDFDRRYASFEKDIECLKGLDNQDYILVETSNVKDAIKELYTLSY